MSIEHEMNIENLISLVQERQSLYDYKHKNYSNRNIQEQLWTEISDILKIPGLYISIIILCYYFNYYIMLFYYIFLFSTLHKSR